MSSRVLFVLNQFPNYTKAPIINQVAGLIDRGFDVAMHSFVRSSVEDIDPKIVQYNMLDRTHFGAPPDDLEEFDLIYCQLGNLGVIYAELLRSLAAPPALITSFRGSDVTDRNKTNATQYAKLFKQGAAFLPVCEYFAYKLKLLGCPPERTRVLRSSIDCELFSPRPHQLAAKNDVVKLLFVGRLVEKKGVSTLLEALATLIHQQRIILNVVGDGPKRMALEKQVLNLGLQDHVKFLGSKSHAEIARILHESDIFVAPSVTDKVGSQEGIPNSLKEAMASELPVVSTYHAGIPELVEHDHSGLLVPERAPRQLARSINRLIENPHAWRPFGRNARNRVCRLYSTEVLLKELVDIISSVTGNSPQLARPHIITNESP